MIDKLKSLVPGLALGGIGGLILGFVLGIYFLPILIAPEGINHAEAARITQHAERNGEFRKDLRGSDFLHWGEGKIVLSSSHGQKFFTLVGELAPGPDYRLYLTPKYVETEEAFHKIKAESVQVGNIKAFTNFHIPVPASINTDLYPAALVWCETFEQFITAAQLEPNTGFKPILP